jgi:hypothetical protein
MTDFSGGNDALAFHDIHRHYTKVSSHAYSGTCSNYMSPESGGFVRRSGYVGSVEQKPSYDVCP